MDEAATARFLALIERAHSGDQSARAELLEANLKLVWSIVGRFPSTGHETDDLFQVGSMGLLRAIDRFDPSYGVQFSTYAVPLIIGEIRRYLRDQGAVKISRAVKERAYRLRRRRDEMGRELGREPTADELAQDAGLPVEQVVEALEVLQPLASLEESVPGGRENQTLGERIAAADVVETEVLRRVELSEELKRLPEIERQVIYWRFFEDKTQAQVAELLGTNQVHISRIEHKALLHLRGYLRPEGAG